jgi:hypothetical protein
VKLRVESSDTGIRSDYDMREHNITRLIYAFGTHNWKDTIMQTDIDDKNSHLLKVS